MLKNTLFGFRGRLRRRDWWVWSIVAAVAYYVLSDATAILLGLDGYVLAQGGVNAVVGDPWLPLTHSIVVLLPVLWVQLALAVKRAHDRAGAAWPFVIVILASVALSYWPVDTYAAAGQGLDSGALVSGAPMIVMGLTFLGSVYQLVVLGLMDGTPGPNRYGRSPKGMGGDPTETTAEVFS